MPAPQKSTRKIPLKNINVNFRVNSIFGKNRQSFLETSLKKNLGSTTPLLVKITVQWLYFDYKNFNHKLVRCYNVNARAISIFGKNSQSFLELPKKNWAALHHFR